MVFDLDGTLLDSIADISESVNRALELNGLAGHTKTEYKTFVGWGAEHLIREAMLPCTDEAIYHAVRGDYDKFYLERCTAGGKPFDGISELLGALHRMGVRTAVCSNKPQAQTEAVCKSTFGALLDDCAGQCTGVPTKPDPAGVRLLLSRMGGECIAYVGDSNVDIETGRNLGAFTIGVSWGMQPREKLLAAGADIIADNVQELLALLRNKT
ncbi:MAG: HAD family hydrolase [Angelakisella sp.]